MERELSHNLHKFTVPIFHCFLFCSLRFRLRSTSTISAFSFQRRKKRRFEVLLTKIELVNGVTAGKVALEIFRRGGRAGAEKIVEKPRHGYAPV